MTRLLGGQPFEGTILLTRNWLSGSPGHSNADVDGIIALLTDDAWLTMPL